MATLAMVVGARQIWHLWVWDIGWARVTVADWGVVAAIGVGVALLLIEPQRLRGLTHAARANRVLVAGAVGLWAWMSFRALFPPDADTFFSVFLQSVRDAMLLGAVAVIATRLGVQKTLVALLAGGVVTAIASLAWFAYSLQNLVVDGKLAFADISYQHLWHPRYGYELAYGKVIQFQGFAQDPIAISKVYGPSFFAGLGIAAVGRSRAFLIGGLAIVSLAIVLSLARSAVVEAALTASVLLLAMIVLRGGAAWRVFVKSGLGLGLAAAFLLLVLVVVQLTASEGITQRVGFDGVWSMLSRKVDGDTSKRITYQSGAVEEVLGNPATALFGVGAKERPEVRPERVIENDYARILFEYGMVGMAFVGAMLAALAVAAARLVRTNRDYGVALAMLAAWLASAGVFGGFVLKPEFWLMMGLILAFAVARPRAARNPSR